MSIESLKAQARRHEQKEEWQKALDQYGKAIATLDQDDQSDIGLYNRVGDLFIKVGDYEKALTHYERAIELYRDAYLPNNAIAVCKKIVRHVPARGTVYLVMGQIRAEQGFLPEARTHFLKYAELMQEAGDLDESFRALVEFADLVREDPEIRITVADQMIANERVEEGVEQLKVAYQILKESGRDDRAFGLESRLVELDPSVDFDALQEAVGVTDGAPDEPVEGFELTSVFEADEDESSVEVFAEEEQGLADTDAAPEEGDELSGEFWTAESEPESEVEEAVASEDGAWEEEADQDGPGLPLVTGTDDFEEEEEDGEEVALPFIGFEGAEDEVEDDAEAEELPLMEVELEVEVVETIEAELVEGDVPGFDEDDPSEDRPIAAVQPEEPTAEESAPIATPDPEERPAAEQYVDLGSMIFGDEPAEPKTTRFRVQYEEPTGDETADFQKMLSQFKEKVSENVEASDVRAHHDLGTAYKEMGLLDEAISEFQAALRASASHLPTYELLGQTFLEMGKNEAAAKSLERALSIPTSVEDEFLGIYYYLARAYEALGRNESAVEFYDRVFSLDINFADVTERLRVLR